MSTETVTLFFALLAVACEVFVVATIGLVVAARSSPSAARLLTRVRLEVGVPGLWLPFAIATVATAGSLYLSEVADFVPCRLCWIQRGFMYPLVPILGVSAALRFVRIRWFAIPWALGGAMVSTWHIMIERNPSLEGSTSCDPTNPCSLIWVKELGYLTIPTMALSGFLAIVTLLALLPSTHEPLGGDEPDTEPDADPRTESVGA